MVRRSHSPPPHLDSRESTRYSRRGERRGGVDEGNRYPSHAERPRYERATYDRNDRRRDRDTRLTHYDEERQRRDRSPNGGRNARDQSRERYRHREQERRQRDRRSVSPPPRATGSRPRTSSAQGQSPPPEDKTKPNFNPSGLLVAATNTVKNADGTSTVLKYNEPPEARKPLLGWRLYVFKGSEQVGKTLVRQSDVSR